MIATATIAATRSPAAVATKLNMRRNATVATPAAKTFKVAFGRMP